MLAATAFLAIVALTVVRPGGAETSPWQTLAPGLELARFEVPPATVEVLRIDPERWETVALAASDTDGSVRTVSQWGREFDLTAVINAGMYATDHRTHVGYFRTGDHVNNGIWNQRDYRQAACFEPREPGLPPFALQDLDAAPESTFAHRYDIVIQNLRLVRKNGDNRWNPGDRRWAEACLGEDASGRMLWIYCRHPHDMHAFNEILLSLPIDLVAAQHLEGGTEAQIWIDPALHTASRTLLNFPIPNVLGIRLRTSE